MKKNSIAISVSSRFLIHVVSPTVAPPLSRCLRGKWEQRSMLLFQIIRQNDASLNFQRRELSR